ncbi:MAG: hypothetical protein IKG82_15415 [Oscillospiraceae bacterium]|nr:hypothetical protein [Oscillospiraceae bacterium]
MLPGFPLALPYPLLDIRSGERYVQLRCTEIVPEYRTPDAERPTDFYCKFGIDYRDCGLSAGFICEMTTGNVYAFYQALEKAYAALDPAVTAELTNYGETDRTRLCVSFDKKGCCVLAGHFMSRESNYQSGVRFCLHTEQSALNGSLHHMRHFFRTLAAAQGHSVFD